jgi:hypothetical protein
MHPWLLLYWFQMQGLRSWQLQIVRSFLRDKEGYTATRDDFCGCSAGHLSLNSAAAA